MAGMKGFLFVMLFSNLFTGILNLRRLLVVTGLRIRWWAWALRPLLALLAGWLAYRSIYLPHRIGPPLWDLILGSGVVSVVYLIFAGSGLWEVVSTSKKLR